jgi:ABC-type branched-subunit amino acid transport system ATPase component
MCIPGPASSVAIRHISNLVSATQSSATDPMILRCENLMKSFDTVQALTGATVKFPDEGLIAIIGPNGAGKSTLINVLTGFCRADSGRCFLGERETTRLAPYEIVRLGVTRTFQDLRLILQVTVLDNVILARPDQRGEQLFYALSRLNVRNEEARNHKVAMRLLGFVGLEQNAYEPAGALSYGEQKLLTLACCLATEANVLLLDEPVAGVHPGKVLRILDLLRELRNDGKLIVFIEHDIATVRLIADHVIVMDQGKVITEGHPGEVLERPEIKEAYLA